MQSVFHPHAQRNAFRRRDVRQQSKLFAPPASQDFARIVFDCRMANHLVMMASMLGVLA
jgi:hypothetical protein